MIKYRAKMITCPHCEGKVNIINEGWHFTKRLNKKVQYARGLCENNDWTNYDDRCLYKTVAVPKEQLNKFFNNSIKRAQKND